MADQAWQAWLTTATGLGFTTLPYAKIMHPTADSHPNITTAQLLQDWNTGLQKLAPAFQVHPAPYGTTFAAAKSSQ